jgi:hypothetical protein
MRGINLSNANKRDATVSIETRISEKKVTFVLKDGSVKKTTKILKTVKSNELSELVRKYGSLDNLSSVMQSEDPEIDIEKTGMILSDIRSVYADDANNIVYQVRFEEVIKNPDNSVKEQKPYVETVSNTASDIPLTWTGKMIPKLQAVRSFVFSRKYQISHVNGLTYDFLFDIARNLHEQNSLVLIGGGKKGNEPLVFQNGGTPYRAFLEGRVKDNRYILILHLSNLEIKEITRE